MNQSLAAAIEEAQQKIREYFRDRSAEQALAPSWTSGKAKTSTPT